MDTKIVKFLKINGIMIFGNFLYALGVNIFITPMNLYSGGVYGFSQLIRTFLNNYITIENIDLAGIIYFILNIPLLILAYKKIGKKFFINTLISVLVGNLFLTFINIKEPILQDTLSNCIVGGMIAGFGAGLTLRAGSSGGGTDILGVYFVKNNSSLSIGQLNLLINVILYSICALLFSLDTAIYSILFSAILSLAVDKTHSQNIKVNALIFTNNYEIAKEINSRLVRGSTSWEGKGDFTGQKKYVISTVISKYEENELKSIVNELDDKAFVIINSNIDTLGYVEKRLDA